jgi:uncharacterized iron-regulated membrane protein
MKQFRKVIFWIHLVCGVTAGIFIFLMCVTGALLSFEPNILKAVESDMRYVRPAQNAQKLPVREIIAKVLEARPNARPSAVTLQNDSQAAAVVALGREGQVYVNPYTGEIIGEGATGWRAAFRVVEDLHRWIALPGEARTVGKTINDVCNLAFLMLALTGVYIWFPRRLAWQNFKSVLWFRRGLGGKARDFNWHNTIGFWTSLVLIVLTVTGAVISYQWAGNLLYTLTGNEVPAQQPQQQSQPAQAAEQPFVVPENLDQIWAKAESHTFWKSISLRLPIARDAAVFTIDEGVYWNIFGRSALTVDARTIEISKWEPYGEQNSARQLRSWARFTHTGETGGFVGQLVGFIACIGGAFLVFTGISLALRRFSGWRVRKAG